MSDIERIEKLQEMLRNDPSNFQARRQLAMLLLDNGYKEEALAHFLHLTEIFKEDGELYYNIGIVYEKLKDLQNARKSYVKAIECEPEDVDSYYNLGLVYTDLGQYDKAIDCFETVLDSDNEDSNTYFNIGICYFKQEKFDSAKYYFERTVQLNPDDLYAHFYLGNIYKNSGESEIARKKFERVLEISPDYSWAYYNLAVLDFEAGDKNSAYENLQKTINFNPKDLETYKIWARMLISDRKFSKALEVVNTALKKCGDNGDLYFLQGEALKALRQIDEAKDALSSALRNYHSLTYDVGFVKEKLNNIHY